MFKKKVLLLIVAALFVLPLLAACGGGSNTVNVTEGTAQDAYTIKLSQDSAKAGQITFHITNNAQSVTHEFVIFKTDLPADQLPKTADGTAVNEDAPQIQHIDEKEDIAPGDTVDLTVNLDAGHYVLICNLPDHYNQGMYASFTVNQ
jgi:uncharacterized cupredoxin-like copper-binding protein